MNNKDPNKPEHLTAEQWRRHLHWIDQCGQRDETTAAQLAQIKKDSRLARHLMPAADKKRQIVDSGHRPFWLIE